MEAQEVIKALRGIGFPISDDVTDKQLREAIVDFQRGFAFGRPLIQDGFVGPKTAEALQFCLKKDGRCSENFRFAEFESKGNTDFTIKLSAALVLDLEERRMELGPIAVLSGYRDPVHNKAVGGKPNSQHLFGNAMDPVTKLAAISRSGSQLRNRRGEPHEQVETRASRAHPSRSLVEIMRPYAPTRRPRLHRDRSRMSCDRNGLDEMAGRKVSA